jgi:hypothetical protein
MAKKRRRRNRKASDAMDFQEMMEGDDKFYIDEAKGIVL